MRVILFISILSCLELRVQLVMEPFIVHGKGAKIKDFPYVAFISIEQDELPWSCGSSIVNQHIILTAAHCLIGCTKRAQIFISVGHETMLMGDISTASGFVIHENYKPESLINDIALVRVNTPISFNSKVSRVALMRKPPHDEEAQIAGWGYINERNRTSTEKLIFTKQRVWSNKDCINRMNNMPVGTFCASDKAGSSYPSIGDSGSALVIRKYIQIGLVSYKKPDISRKVIVYTDTGYFYKWIKKTSKRLVCS